MLKVLALVSALLLALLPAAAPPAHRATCPSTVQGPPCQEFWRADAVFVGYVTEAVGAGWPPDVAPYSQYSKLTARLAVEEAFRGSVGSQVTLEMDNCPHPFKEGERYLVYANRDRDGKLHQRLGYTRTRPLSEAGEDMAYIRGLSQSPPGGRIYGIVSRDASDYRLRGGGTDAEWRPRGSGGGVAGVKVVAEGQSQRYEATTDGAGRYEFTGLPAGSYTVNADTPTGPSGIRIQNRSGVSVTDRGCARSDIHLMPEGELGGVVTSAAGLPVKDVGVALFSAEGATEEKVAGLEGGHYMMSTDVRGRYRFVGLPAGRYYVVVSVPAGEGPMSTNYRRTFHPNAASLAEAAAVTLAEGQKKTDADVRLPPQ